MWFLCVLSTEKEPFLWLLMVGGVALALVEVSVIEVCCRQSFMKHQRLEADPTILTTHSQGFGFFLVADGARDGRPSSA